MFIYQLQFDSITDYYFNNLVIIVSSCHFALNSPNNLLQNPRWRYLTQQQHLYVILKVCVVEHQPNKNFKYHSLFSRFSTISRNMSFIATVVTGLVVSRERTFVRDVSSSTILKIEMRCRRKRWNKSNFWVERRIVDDYTWAQDMYIHSSDIREMVRILIIRLTFHSWNNGGNYAFHCSFYLWLLLQLWD